MTMMPNATRAGARAGQPLPIITQTSNQTASVNEPKKYRRGVNLAANFPINDGANIVVRVKNRKSAVAIGNLDRFNDGRYTSQSHSL
jgi:hypothetical protein